ncbi:hypothetical protein PQ462_09530 [Flavobacterium sp. KACC 22758]|uniref:hypothetical protein n=1 Tax=Flavobacterium sp. KACC 22758 TaxID=3025667 RepID=UPI0023662319|nr:hypothetical protein [Flavobacterium sp. KACC 22758]WDF61611.1 hypothetical protein PQ462_09530 [Flavobacterium sp. KACC 22758]
MKKIIFPLIILLLISCKKENDLKVIANKENDTITIKNGSNLIPYGDELISKYDFVSKIENGESVKSKRENLSKIIFDYNKFDSWDFNAIETENTGDIVLKFSKEEKDNSDADIYTHIILSTFKNNKKIDEITVYKNENYSEALALIRQFFYIDSNLDLWLLEINEDEAGIRLRSWNQYKIDKKNGKIELVKSNKISSNTNGKNENNDQWKGKYIFEKEDLNNLMTSFEITINSLDNILLVYKNKGEAPKVYKNLVAKIEPNNKIKIVFNEKDQDMGSIYIQSDEGEYTISGKPLSIINPGNDEYYLKKK